MKYVVAIMMLLLGLILFADRGANFLAPVACASPGLTSQTTPPQKASEIITGAGDSQASSQPAVLQGVGIDQKLGARLPMDLVLRDEAGSPVRLGELFRGRPILFTLVYYRCPGLCTMTLNQLSRSLNALSESAGEQFDIITVSFDANESPQLAAEKKAGYLRGYRRPSAQLGWHFLTGDTAAIAQLTGLTGFRYRYDQQSQQFVHASALMVLSPDGTLCKYFLGVEYPPNDLREAIRSATAGKVSAPAEQVYFYCFRYDAATGKYGLIINRALRVLGVGTIFAIAITLFVLQRRSRSISVGGTHARL